MKIIPQDFQVLKHLISNNLKNKPSNIIRYYADNKIGKDPAKAARWDIFYVSNIPADLIDKIYAYANDDHIDTALKQIFIQLESEVSQ